MPSPAPASATQLSVAPAPEASPSLPATSGKVAPSVQPNEAAIDAMMCGADEPAASRPAPHHAPELLPQKLDDLTPTMRSMLTTWIQLERSPHAPVEEALHIPVTDADVKNYFDSMHQNRRDALTELNADGKPKWEPITNAGVKMSGGAKYAYDNTTLIGEHPLNWGRENNFVTADGRTTWQVERDFLRERHLTDKIKAAPYGYQVNGVIDTDYLEKHSFYVLESKDREVRSGIGTMRDGYSAEWRYDARSEIWSVSPIVEDWRSQDRLPSERYVTLIGDHTRAALSSGGRIVKEPK